MLSVRLNTAAKTKHRMDQWTDDWSFEFRRREFLIVEILIVEESSEERALLTGK